MSADRGPASPNFVRNFAYGILTITNTCLKLTNQFINVIGATQEAVYAQSLVVVSNATLDLAGFDLYVRQAQLSGTVSNGAVTQIPDSGPITRNTGTSGTILLPGEMDEWTFYGRGGETVAVVANTGPDGAFAPTAPQLGYAEILLVEINGQVLASATSSGSNQVVTITNATLSADGSYRVRIHAPGNHSAAVGHYTVVVWDVITHQFPAVLNQQQAGTLPTPFSEDCWSFAASSNQVIQLVPLGSPWGIVKYDLFGPNGWVGFTNINYPSGPITLPESGVYTLMAYGQGGGSTVQYTFRIDAVATASLAPGTALGDQFVGRFQMKQFKTHLDHSSPLRVSVECKLPPWSTIGVRLRYGLPPSLSVYDKIDFLRNMLTVSGLGCTILGIEKSQSELVIPMAAEGDWFVLLYVYELGSPTNFTISAKADGVLLESISSSHLAGNVPMSLILNGAGFKYPAQVTLVGPGGAEYAASEVLVDSYSQITATFAPNTIPAGTYSIRVSTGASSWDTLAGAFQVVSSGAPQLRTSLSVPGRVGYHMVAEVDFNYGNTGDAAMPAPLLVLSAIQNGLRGALLTFDASRVSAGLWSTAKPKDFSQTLQMLGSGNTPGLLQPGESMRVAAHYAGWLQPWDLRYPPIQFTLGTLTEDDTTPMDWPSLKNELRPPRLSDGAWDALWANFTGAVGPLWGNYVAMLNNNARYLGRLDMSVRDISELLRFAFLQANGLSPLKTLASSQDAAVDVPGVPLRFVRSYPQSITDRHRVGPFGYGWSHSWEITLGTATDGTVTILSPGSSQRTFQPDVRGGYFADKGDYGTLRATGGGTYNLQEKNGLLTAFRSDGKLDYIQDPNGNRVIATYAGTMLTRLTHSAGPWLQLEYNGSNLVSRITDSVGRITDYTYDGTSAHLGSVQQPDLRLVSYQYLAPGTVQREHALSEIAYPGGTHRYLTYDAAGRLESIARDDDQQRVTFAYDKAGRVTATDAAGGTTRFYFDHYGRLAKTEDPLGRAVGYAHDSQHNLTSLTGPEGHTYDYNYDQRGNLIKMTDPQREETEFAYANPYNRLNLLTDANGHATRHESDAAGNLAGIISTDGTYESWSHNTQGLPTVWRSRRGQQVSLAYDGNGRLTRKSYPDGSEADYSYDAHGNLLFAVNSSGTIGFTYNARDELTRVDYPGGKWLQFAYDAAGRRSNSLDQLGHQLNYAYDTVGRLQRMTDERGSNVVQYTYDVTGRVSRKAVGNGTYTTYAYDLAGQLLGLTNYAAGDSVLSFFRYTFDSRGRRTSMETDYGTWSYDYDDLGQLTRAVLASADPTIPNQDLAYLYDALGNRIRTVENGVTNDYTVNALNQYTQVGNTGCEFDADGNLVRETSPSGTNEYTYNFENRLVAVAKGGKTWQYYYDGLGNRIATTENGVTTAYVLDPAGLGNVVGEYDFSGNLVARYDHDFGLLSRTDESGNQAYYAFDAIGNVHQLVTASGTVANEYAYSPFGTELRKDESLANPFQFVGRYGVVDTGFGLRMMRARFLSNEIGRFLQRDPIDLMSGDLNIYRYVGNDPVLVADPRGTQGVMMMHTAGFGSAAGVYMSNGEFIEKVIVEMSGMPDPNEPPDPFGDAFKEGLKRAMEEARKRSELRHGSMPRPEGPWISLDGRVPGLLPPGPPLGFNRNPLSPPDTPVPPSSAVVTTAHSQAVGAIDPNEKSGPSVYGPDAFVSVNAVLPYRIEFENDRTATAPAQTVFITDQLGTNFSWGSFMLTEIGFGDQRIEIPAGWQEYETVVPMSYGGVDFEVHIQAGIDLQTGLITARFMSIDPDTGLPPANANAGFLPPEDGTGRGMGFLNYTVRTQPNLPTGAQIRNVAYITFDFIETIGTNQRDPHDPSQGTDPELECFSTLDAAAPTSSVGALPTTVTTSDFTVTWSGADEPHGSGVAAYSIYVSTNGGPYTLWLNNTPETQGILTGVDGVTYQFRSAATDNVGNQESPWSATSSAVMVDLLIVISLLRLQGNNVVITWNSRPERRYQVWVNRDLSGATGWTNLTDYLPASGYSMSYTNSLENGSAFFRVTGRD